MDVHNITPHEGRHIDLLVFHHDEPTVAIDQTSNVNNSHERVVLYEEDIKKLITLLQEALR